MGFLDDICVALSVVPREPVQLDLALPVAPEPKAIPPEALPPRHYRICDRMLPPSFFYGTVDAPIGTDGKFMSGTILDAEAPPPGTVMRFKWHMFDDDRNASGCVVVLSEQQAFEAWERHLADVGAEDRRWRDLVEEATKQNAARDFNLSLAIRSGGRQLRRSC